MNPEQKFLAAEHYQHVLHHQFLQAAQCLDRYRNQWGYHPPLLPIEDFLAVRQTLKHLGRPHWKVRLEREVVAYPGSTFWHRLIYFYSLSSLFGFLVTLELLDGLEHQIKGLTPAPSPIQRLILKSWGENPYQNNYLPRRDREILQDLPPLSPIEDEEERRVCLFALDCLRCEFYTYGYWQRTAEEYMGKCEKALPEVLPKLREQPLLCRYILASLVACYGKLCLWEKGENLLKTLFSPPEHRLFSVIWESYYARGKYDLNRAVEILEGAKEVGKESVIYWEQWGGALMKLEKYQPAIQCWKAAQNLMGDRQNSRYYQIPLGFCHYQVEKIPEAIGYWRESKNSYYTRQADRLDGLLKDGKGLSPYKKLEVPGIHQKPNHCGPCALAMILNFWGEKIIQEELAEELTQWGSNLFEICKSTEKRGYATLLGKRDFDAVRDTILAGFPVLLDFSYPGGGHFVVAVGYDENLDVIEILDPSYVSNWYMSRDKYKASSAYLDFESLVILPQDRVDQVPALGNDGAFHRDMVKAYYNLTSLQESLEFLHQNHSEESLKAFNLYRELLFSQSLQFGKIDSARNLAEEILKSNECSLYACSRIAQIYLYQKRTQDALEVLARIQDGENHEYFQFIQGKGAAQIGDFKKALISLLNSINLYPARGDKFLSLAYLMEQLGEEEEQLKYLDIAQQISGPNLGARFSEVRIYRKRQDCEKVLSLVQESIELFPGQSQLLFDLGAALEDLDREEEALECYQKLTREIPAWYLGYYSQIRIFYQWGDDEKALKTLDEMEEKIPEDPNTWCTRAWWFEKKENFDRALEETEKALGISMDYPWACYLKASSLERKGQLKEALSTLEQIIEKVDPSHYYWKESIHCVARIGRKIQDMSFFESIFARALEKAPDSYSLWQAISESFLFSGDVVRAQEFFTSLYEKVTNKAGLALEAGALMEDLSRLEEARKWYSLIPDENSHFSQAILGLCRTLKKEKKFAETLKVLVPLTESQPSPQIYSLIVSTYLDLYNPLEGMEWYRKGVQLYPHNLIWSSLAYRLLDYLKAYGPQKNLEEMVQFFEEIRPVLSGEKVVDFQIYQAYGLDLLDRTIDAIELCRKALADYPASGMGWIILADMEFKTGQFEVALASARRSCQTRYSTYPFNRLFVFLMDMGRGQEAFEICIEGLQAFPGELKFQELLEDLVLKFQMLDRYKEACGNLFPLIEDKGTFLGNQGILFMRMGELELAREYYEKALEFGDQPWLYVNLGLVAKKEWDFARAEEMLQRALELYPQYEYASKLLAEVYSDWYLSQDSAQGARGLSESLSKEELENRIHGFYRRGLLFNPDNVALFGVYSKFCTKIGNLSFLEELLGEIEEHSHFLPDLYAYLAVGFESLRNYPQALNYLEKAVALPAEDSLKIWVYYRMGWHQKTFYHRTEEAKKWYHKALEGDPEYDAAYFGLVELLREEDDLEGVWKLLWRGVETLPSPEGLFEELGSLAVSMRREEELFSSLKRNLEKLSPKGASSCLLKLTKGLGDEFNLAAAEKASELAMGLYQEPVELLKTKLNLLLRRSMFDEAREVVDQILSLDSDNLTGLFERASLQLKEGNFEEALLTLEKYYRFGGKNYSFLLTLFYNGRDLNLLSPFMEFCQNLYPLSSVRGDIHLLMGLTHFSRGDDQEGSRFIESISQVDESLKSYGNLLLAQLRAEESKISEALEWLSRAVEEDPQYYYARCCLLGYLLSEERWEEARDHLKCILLERTLSSHNLEHMTLPLQKKSSLLGDPSLLEKAFLELPRDSSTKSNFARYYLFRIANNWNLSSQALDLAREVSGGFVHSDWIPYLFAEAMDQKDEELGQELLERGRGGFVSQVSLCQMESMLAASRGKGEEALARALAAKEGHGSHFGDMCWFLHEVEGDLPSLYPHLFESYQSYHRNHSSCAAALFHLLLEGNQSELFEKGLEILSQSLTDYNLRPDRREKIRAAVLALKWVRARRDGRSEEALKIFRELESIPCYKILLPVDLLRRMEG